MAIERVVVPSTKALIYIEDFDLEFRDDIFDLGLGLYNRKKDIPDDDQEALAKCIADYLNERWSEHLGDNKLEPAHSLRVMKPIMERINEIKKNLLDSVK